MFLVLVIAHVVAISHGQAGVPEPRVPVFLAYALADGVDPMDHALLDGDAVHVFLPPVLVSKGRLLSADWSEDGRYLLVASERTDMTPSEYRTAWEGRRMQPRGRAVEIYLFNSKSASAKLLYFEESKSVPKVEIEFFGNGDAAIATIANPPAGTSKVLRLTAGSSRVEEIEIIREPELIVDPTGKYIAVGASDGTVRFVSARGQALKRQPLPNGRSVEFDRDGKAYSSPKPTEMVRVFPEGGYAPVQEPVDWPYLGKTPMTGVFAYPIKVNVQDRRFGLPAVAATLHSGGRSIIIAFDAHSPEATPESTGVFYVSNGYNYVRPVVQITKTAFDKMLLQRMAERTGNNHPRELVWIGVNGHATQIQSIRPLKPAERAMMARRQVLHTARILE